MYKCTREDLWCPNKNSDQICHANIDLICSAQIYIDDEQQEEEL